MNKVFVVMGSCQEYESSDKWPVRAFDCEDEAAIYIQDLNDLVEKLGDAVRKVMGDIPETDDDEYEYAVPDFFFFDPSTYPLVESLSALDPFINDHDKGRKLVPWQLNVLFSAHGRFKYYVESVDKG